LEALYIFSAGAAQAVVARLARMFQLEGDGAINTSYGAVHSMKSCILAKEPADVIILTDTLIDELMEKNLVVRGSRMDLGTVGTGVAVRANTPRPAVASVDMLRATLLASSKIICPDPASATAGKVLLNVLDQLGIADQVRPRLSYCISGYEAIAELARGTAPLEIGVMQMTEIVANDTVDLAGPLPGDLQSLAVYSAGLVMHSRSPERAVEFIRQLAGQRDVLNAAGFGEPHSFTSVTIQKEN